MKKWQNARLEVVSIIETEGGMPAAPIRDEYSTSKLPVQNKNGDTMTVFFPGGELS